MRFRFVLAEYPFDELSRAKVRPALCLTDPLGKKRHITVAFITSQIPTTLEPTEVIIDETVQDFGQTGLRTASVILLHRVFSVPESLIVRRLGMLPKALQDEVKAKLATIFL